MSSRATTATEVVYRSGGHDVTAMLYEPSAPADRGAAVLLCPGRTRDILGLEFVSRGLAASGIVVLATRYRGMELRTDDADAAAGLDFLGQLAEVDDQRLGIVGHSRGGVCALRMAAADQRVRTVVALEPPVDLANIVRATAFLSSFRYRALIDQLGGTPDDSPERYKALSTLSIAGEIQVPTLILAGALDLYSPEDHCRDMYEAIVAGGNDQVELVTMDIGHFFESTYHGYEFDKVQRLVTDWFQSRLGVPS